MSIVVLKRVAAAAGFGFISGCTTIAIPTGGTCIEGEAVVAPLNLGMVSSQKYKADCGQTFAGTEMAKSADVGVRATGMLVLEGNNPAIHKAANATRQALVNSDNTTESYRVEKQADGSIKFVGTPIVTVPKLVEKAAVAPEQSVAAPAASMPAPSGP